MGRELKGCRFPEARGGGCGSLEVWSSEESAETQEGELQFSIALEVGVRVSSENCGAHSCGPGGVQSHLLGEFRRCK